MRFDKSATALKRFRIPFGAAAALSLLMAAWSPAATATTACEQVRAAIKAYYDGGLVGDYPMKPKNVAIDSHESSADGSITFTVSFDLPSNRPVATVTGHTPYVEHEATEYWSSTYHTGSETSSDIRCPLTTSPCTGSFRAKVKLSNNCGITEYSSDWSDSYEISSDE